LTAVRHNRDLQLTVTFEYSSPTGRSGGIARRLITRFTAIGLDLLTIGIDQIGVGISTDSARGPETTGNNRYDSDKQPRWRGSPARRWGGPLLIRSFGKPQLNGPTLALEQLPGHHHALDLVGALVDLGVVGSNFRRSGRVFVIGCLTS
jgi:hypothetical protein